MRNIERILRAGRLALLVVTGWLASHGAAVAQFVTPNKNQPGTETLNSNVWVFAYFLAILGIVAGLLAVCLSGRRRERARPEQYGEGKVAVEDEKK